MSHNETKNLPAVIAGEASSARRRGSVGPTVCATLEAQRLGQLVSRRGLRGGPAVIGAARAAYLSTQWSGADDRRPAPGLITRARV